jgi:hypothetical protein
MSYCQSRKILGLSAVTSCYQLVTIGLFLWGCGAAAPNPAPLTSQAAVATTEPVPSASSRELRSIAQPNPTSSLTSRLVIHNTFVTRQYLFLDDKPIGVAQPTQEIAFDVTPGTHIVLVSDSADGRSNPQHLVEIYDAGYEYRYDIVAR